MSYKSVAAAGASVAAVVGVVVVTRDQPMRLRNDASQDKILRAAGERKTETLSFFVTEEG